MKIKRVSQNERLEFLGDAVLELITSEYLYHENDSMVEGDLSKLRASLVCEQTLSECAKKLTLGNYLYLGKGEDASGGRNRPSILSDALEAVIGAIYLDSGYPVAEAFIRKHILGNMEEMHLFIDSKTKLQELVQNEYKMKLQYQLISEEGPDHDKYFTVQAMMDDVMLASGGGKSKKIATQDAAYRSLILLEKKRKVTNGGTDVFKEH